MLVVMIQSVPFGRNYGVSKEKTDRFVFLFVFLFKETSLIIFSCPMLVYGDVSVWLRVYPRVTGFGSSILVIGFCLGVCLGNKVLHLFNVVGCKSGCDSSSSSVNLGVYEC